MNVDYTLFLQRAGNELKLAGIVLKLSNNQEIQRDVFLIEEPETYYSAVIAHAYYSIFYAAKAYLLKKNIKIEAPEEHKKTYEAFKKLVEEGIVDVQLLKLYERVLVQADTLLDVLRLEKQKRGKFTYQQISQANLEPANESMRHAKVFKDTMYELCF